MSIIQLKNITMKFGSFIANNNITIKFKPGEIHTLLGENGAGKSTLISILQGTISPTSGDVFFDKKKIRLNPKKSKKNGIYVIPQHFNMINNATIIDNIIASSLDGSEYFINRIKIINVINKICKKYNININPNSKIQDLTIGQKQLVEILRMLYRKSNIIILDEPTAILNKNEIKNLILLLKQMRKQNKTIIFISHKLDEVIELSDVISVLHKGVLIKTFKKQGITRDKLIKSMSGDKKITTLVNNKKLKPGKLVFSVENICVKGINLQRTLKDISIKVFENEIVGIASIDGNGEHEFLDAIIGNINVSSGFIKFCNKDITLSTIKERREMGIAYVPIDTNKHAIAKNLPIFSNILLNTFDDKSYYRWGLFFKYKKGKEIAKNIIKDFDIRGAKSLMKLATQLSGGNLQKVVVARELSLNAKLTILSEPTKGLDVNAINNIYNKVIKYKENGNSVLIYSSEITELVRVCDRVYVFNDGAVRGMLNKNITENNIMELLI